MLDGHCGELAAAFLGENDKVGAAVVRVQRTLHQGFFHQLVGETRHIATGDHEVTREQIHAQALRVACKLGQIVEARQRGAKARPQLAPDLLLDLRAAGQQAQPDFHVQMVFDLGAGFEADVLVTERIHELKMFGVVFHGRALTSLRPRTRTAPGR